MEIIVNFFMSLGNLFKIYVIDILAGINLVSVIDILIVSILMFGIYKFIRDRRASKLALGLGLIFALIIRRTNNETINIYETTISTTIHTVTDARVSTEPLTYDAPEKGDIRLLGYQGEW